MQPLISVIVPIYNVESYLKKCVDSLVNQTYKNLEIILVDDGSPDNCPQICDDLAKTDGRISVVHKENGGLSDARNAGMKIATGEFVCFIDSDDYVSADFIETLYNILDKENSDIAECNLVKFYEDRPINEAEICTENSVKSYDTQQGLSMQMIENEFHQHVWNKLYRSSIVLNVPFAKGKLNEDEFWTYKIFGSAKKVSKTSKQMYFYLQRGGSIMGATYNLRRLDALEAKAERQKYIEENFPELASQAKVDLFGSCIFACQSAMKFLKGSEKKQAKKIIKEYKRICKLSSEDINSIDGGAKKWFKLASINFDFCCKVRAIMGIGF